MPVREAGPLTVIMIQFCAGLPTRSAGICGRSRPNGGRNLAAAGPSVRRPAGPAGLSLPGKRYCGRRMRTVRPGGPDGPKGLRSVFRRRRVRCRDGRERAVHVFPYCSPEGTVLRGRAPRAPAFGPDGAQR